MCDVSHSTRVRGLKFPFPRLFYKTVWSHSTRVRGLKYGESMNELMDDGVALYTSAWIEIFVMSGSISISSVALYTSAWIEIFLVPPSPVSFPVALYTSAWIEI